VPFGQPPEGANKMDSEPDKTLPTTTLLFHVKPSRKKRPFGRDPRLTWKAPGAEPTLVQDPVARDVTRVAHPDGGLRLETQLLERRPRPTLCIKRGRLGDHEATTLFEKWSRTLRRHRRPTEGTGYDQVTTASKLFFPARVLCSGPQHLNPGPKIKAFDRLLQEHRSSLLRFHQHDVGVPPPTRQDQSREAASCPEIDEASWLAHRPGKPPGMAHPVV
jgi:hypothetical protein